MEEKEPKHLSLWNSVEKTNPKHTKKVTFGRTFTAIDPYHQIKNATEAFGPAGRGWGWEVSRVDYTTTSTVAILIRLWWDTKDCYIEQWGQAGLFMDNAEKKKDADSHKKATTDGITKCLSCLGFNADIFLGKFEDNKYVTDVAAEFKEAEEKKNPMPKEPKVFEMVGNLGDKEDKWLKWIQDTIDRHVQDNDIDELVKLYKTTETRGAILGESWAKKFTDAKGKMR